jgi:hypothetical protein
LVRLAVWSFSLNNCHRRPLTVPSNICCFLYPAYASYKALSTPSSDPAGDILIERWLMYWAVVGTWTGVEALGGWLFTWCVRPPTYRPLCTQQLGVADKKGYRFTH